MAKQKLEDLQWLHECTSVMVEVEKSLAFYRDRVGYFESHPNEIAIGTTISEAETKIVELEEYKSSLSEEMERTRHRIATHNYEPYERRRQASIARLGKESVYW